MKLDLTPGNFGLGEVLNYQRKHIRKKMLSDLKIQYFSLAPGISLWEQEATNFRPREVRATSGAIKVINLFSFFFLLP